MALQVASIVTDFKIKLDFAVAFSDLVTCFFCLANACTLAVESIKAHKIKKTNTFRLIFIIKFRAKVIEKLEMQKSYLPSLNTTPKFSVP